MDTRLGMSMDTNLGMGERKGKMPWYSTLVRSKVRSKRGREGKRCAERDGGRTSHIVFSRWKYYCGIFLFGAGYGGLDVGWLLFESGSCFTLLLFFLGSFTDVTGEMDTVISFFLGSPR